MSSLKLTIYRRKFISVSWKLSANARENGLITREKLLFNINIVHLYIAFGGKQNFKQLASNKRCTYS